MFILITYDVAAERTPKFHKILSQYLTWFQNSVFSGDLPESQQKKLHASLSKIMTPEDRLIQITAENRHNVEIMAISKNSGNGALEFTSDTTHTSDSKVI